MSFLVDYDWQSHLNIWISKAAAYCFDNQCFITRDRVNQGIRKVWDTTPQS